MICKNVAPAGYGIYPSTRWYDAIQPKKREARTGEQIVADVIKKAGLKVVSKAEPV